jgi:hypothetical protein
MAKVMYLEESKNDLPFERKGVYRRNLEHMDSFS